MQKISDSVDFLIKMAKTQSMLTHRLDRCLGGLGFNEFLLLFHLNNGNGQQMRRVDLASKIGMTASGVTRLLLPMEKVHLIQSGQVEHDARVRGVMITDAGREKFFEALDRLEMLVEDIFPKGKTKEIKVLADLFVTIGGRGYMV